MGECTLLDILNNKYEHVTDAIECRDKIEKESGKPLRISIKDCDETLSISTFSAFEDCTEGASFGSGGAPSEYDARRCAEALTRLTGKFHGVKVSSGFWCEYSVTTNPLEIDTSDDICMFRKN